MILKIHFMYGVDRAGVRILRKFRDYANIEYGIK